MPKEEKRLLHYNTHTLKTTVPAHPNVWLKVVAERLSPSGVKSRVGISWVIPLGQGEPRQAPQGTGKWEGSRDLTRSWCSPTPWWLR